MTNIHKYYVYVILTLSFDGDISDRVWTLSNNVFVKQVWTPFLPLCGVKENASGERSELLSE